MTHSTTTIDHIDHPSRLLIAAGIKRGAGPLVTVPAMSAADRAAHALSSYVRPARTVRLRNRANDACPICGFWSCRCGKAKVTS